METRPPVHARRPVAARGHDRELYSREIIIEAIVGRGCTGRDQVDRVAITVIM